MATQTLGVRLRKHAYKGLLNTLSDVDLLIGINVLIPSHSTKQGQGVL